jgi:hypothetical protein
LPKHGFLFGRGKGRGAECSSQSRTAGLTVKDVHALRERVRKMILEARDALRVAQA